MGKSEYNGKYEKVKEEFEKIQKRYSGKFSIRRLLGLGDEDRKSLEKCVHDLESIKNNYQFTSERARSERRCNSDYANVEYLQDVIRVYIGKFK
jgi:hypothetical protein